MDANESELIREVQRRREELIASAEALRRTASATLDPRQYVRRRPIGTVFASLATGLALALFPSRRKQVAGERASGTNNWVLDLARDFLKDLGPAFLTSILANVVRSSIPARDDPSGTSSAGSAASDRPHA